MDPKTLQEGRAALYDLASALCKDRDEALRTLDEAPIRAYAEKWGIKLPLDNKEFWIHVHELRVKHPDFTEQEKGVSRKWLRLITTDKPKGS